MTDSDNPSFLIDPVARTVTLIQGSVELCLEQAVWDAFDEICRRETVEADVLITEIERRTEPEGLAAKVTAYVTGYFKDALMSDPPPHRGLSESDDDDGTPSDTLLDALDAVEQAGRR